MEWLSDPQAWAALATLTALEIVLGIDNIIFISILVGRLPAHQREKARVLGLALAMLTRLALLLSLVWVMSLNTPLFSVLDQGISGRDLILIAGGLFLLVKSTSEIHDEPRRRGGNPQAPGRDVVRRGADPDRHYRHRVLARFGDHRRRPRAADLGDGDRHRDLGAVMMFAARAISDFVDTHPTIKMLALSFLILVGTALIAEGLDFHVPRGYIYFAMAFSVAVEMLNLRMRRHAAPVKLHKPVARKRRT